MAILATGSVFAGHRIEGVAGRGGMGVVYRATHLGLDRTVALKVIAAEFAEDEDFRQRFKREARIAASIDHPNVIPLFESGEEDGQLFMSMRFVKGTDLGKVIASEGPLEIGRAAGIVDQVADALDAAHEAGLVHRDVKPANVLIERRSRGEHANLTDFGLTRLAAPDTDLTDTGMIVGTVDYCSPEQLQGKRRLDARTDVYSLGCLLFHTLTGQPPFPRETAVAKIYAHANDPPPLPSEQVPGLPAVIDDVVRRAMAKDPGERYLSAGDLGRAALAAARGVSVTRAEQSVASGDAAPGTGAEPVAAAAETVPAPGAEAATERAAAPSAPPETKRPLWRRKGIRVAVGAAMVLLATAGAVVALTAGGDPEPEKRSGPGGGRTSTGQLPSFNGDAGHLARSRSIVNFLERNDGKPVRLDVGFPDLSGTTYYSERDVPCPGGQGTCRGVSSIYLFTKCNPPLSQGEKPGFKRCTATSLELNGRQTNDSAGFLNLYQAPKYKGYFQVDVSSYPRPVELPDGLQVGVSPIRLKPLTSQQATGG